MKTNNLKYYLRHIKKKVKRFSIIFLEIDIKDF